MTSCALGLFRNVMRSLSGCFESGALSVPKLLDGIIWVRCFETAALSDVSERPAIKKTLSVLESVFFMV